MGITWPKVRNTIREKKNVRKCHVNSVTKVSRKLGNRLFLWGGVGRAHPCDPSPRSATVNGSSKRIFLSTGKIFGAWPGTSLRIFSEPLFNN